MKKIIAVIGTRPQFIKHCPVELSARGIFELLSVNTGQHYDYNMSQVFLDQLNIKPPAYTLEIGERTLNIDPRTQVQNMMDALIPVIQKENPAGILVYGDTNSTLAGAMGGKTLGIPVFHVEAGLRSFNSDMPEERNRVLTDQVSSLLFAPSSQAVENLNAEGIHKNVFMVGDVMLDMLQLALQSHSIGRNKISSDPFVFATIHRPYNTEEHQRLFNILEALQSLPYKVRFSVHPRIQSTINDIMEAGYSNIEFLPPLSYYDTIDHIIQSKAVITDSGGLQKEAYFLRKKCITIRSETEWTETLDGSWNTLVFDELDTIASILDAPCGEYTEGLFGTGHASKDIVRIIDSFLA